MNNADLRDATTEIKLADLYLGVGNRITYFDEQHGLQVDRIVSEGRGDRAEVIVYVNPQTGARSSEMRMLNDVRTFEFVDKLSISRINDELVSIVA